MTAVNKTFGWGMSGCVAALALVLNVGVASAQQKAPDAPAKDAVKSTTPPAPAVKAPAAKDAKAPAKDVKAPVAKAPAAKAAAACKTVKVQADCESRKEDCDWIGEAAITKGPNAGKKQAAYCRSLPKKAAPAKDKAAPVKEKAAAPAKAPAPAAAKAPAAPAPAAKAPAPAAQPAPAPAPAPKN